MTYPMNASDAAMAMPAGGENAAAMSSTSYRMMRPGMRPLVFQGSELAMAMSFTPELPYWYELNIYRTTEQKFVLGMKLFFVSETETDRRKAWEFETLPALFDALEAYDAGDDVRFGAVDFSAMPAAELAAHACDLAARVNAQRAHFGTLVGELFEQMEAAGQAA